MNLKQAAERLGKRGLLVALATTLAFSAPGCLGPTETGKYAKQLNLPEETMAIANQLSYDANTIALLDEISDLPEEVQVNEQFLDYLNQIAADKVVTDDELAGFSDFDQDGLPNNDELEHGTDLFNADSDNDGVEDAEEVEYGTDPLEPSPGLKQALDYLLTFPEENFKETIELGLDDVIVDYLLLLSSLNDQDFAKYALENKLGFQDRNLTELEIKFLNQPDNYGQELFDYYISKVNSTNPELSNELLKLPDFQEIDVEDIEAVEDVVDLTKGESVFGTSLDSILNEGIRDKRKYCSPLEALIWLLYDYDEEYLKKEIARSGFFWEAYQSVYGATEINPSLRRLVSFSWEESSKSKNFLSSRWNNFDEVVDRLNSPLLVSLYTMYNISYDHEMYQMCKQTGRFYPQTLEQTFNGKKGMCGPQSSFALNCLLQNGYQYDNFELHRNNAACVLNAFEEPRGPGKSHCVCLFISEGTFYAITTSIGINGLIIGPFATVSEAADATWKDWDLYRFFSVSLLPSNNTKEVRR